MCCIRAEVEADKSEKRHRAERKRCTKRLRYYHAHIDQMLLDKGEMVDVLRPVYVIFFCLKDPFGGSLPVYTFKNRCVEDSGTQFEDGAASIVVATDNFEQEGDPGLAALMRYLLTNVPDEDDLLTVELAQAVDRAYEDESWVGTMLTYEQEIAHKEYLAREEGEEVGRANVGRRYEALVSRLDELEYGDDELGKLLRENTLDELFSKFEIA